MFKYLLAALVAVVVAFLCPDNVQFNREFAKGQLWHYDDLNAPFDFAILKPEQTLQEETARIKAEFSPYYRFDESIVKRQVAEFGLAFENKLASVAGTTSPYPDVGAHPDLYRKAGEGMVSRFYQRGIVELTPEHLAKPDDFVINIVKGNTTEQHTKSGLTTLGIVKNVLGDTLMALPLKEPDFLYHILDGFFRPNVYYSDTLSKKFLSVALGSVSKTSGKVSKDELIVEKGNVITEGTYQKLVSFKQAYEREITKKKNPEGVFFGYLLMALLILGIYVIYLHHYQKTIFNGFLSAVFLLAWPALFTYLTHLLGNNGDLSVYLVPYCIAPIVIKNFFSKRLAFFTHIIIVMLSSMVASLGYEFLFLQLLVGFTAAFNNVVTKEWSKFFASILLIFLTYSSTYAAFQLINEGTVKGMNLQVFSWFFLNAIFLLLSYPLIPLLGRIFGFTSYITLMELSDLNNPLLRELSIKAAGTFQHSLQVASMAEAAANAIGADAPLVRVGTLYHDVGKTKNPLFFIENQSDKNPHDDLTYVESAQTIIAHVKDGAKMAKKQGLPKVVIDFIWTHHGTARTEYFFKHQIKEHPDEAIDEGLFRYPGPRPSTREQTIVMLADSLEASAKSLKTPTEHDLNALVEYIIAGKIDSGQLDHSQLSFAELETCKQVFKKMLRSIHHARIAYPT